MDIGVRIGVGIGVGMGWMESIVPFLRRQVESHFHGRDQTLSRDRSHTRADRHYFLRSYCCCSHHQNCRQSHSPRHVLEEIASTSAFREIPHERSSLCRCHRPTALRAQIADQHRINGMQMDTYHNIAALRDRHMRYTSRRWNQTKPCPLMMLRSA